MRRPYQLLRMLQMCTSLAISKCTNESSFPLTRFPPVAYLTWRLATVDKSQSRSQDARGGIFDETSCLAVVRTCSGDFSCAGVRATKCVELNGNGARSIGGCRRWSFYRSGLGGERDHRQRTQQQRGSIHFSQSSHWNVCRDREGQWF